MERAITGPAPDLIVTDSTEPPSEGPVGTTFTVTDTVKNLGTAAAPASSTRYWLSLDRLKGATNRALSPVRAVPALDVGGENVGSAILAVAAGTPAGSYYVLACADGNSVVAESNETNNCRSSAKTMLVGGPDLHTSAVSDPPATVVLGQTFTITDTVQNLGTAAAPASRTYYLLSTDTIKNSGDSALSFVRDMGPLAPGEESTGTATVSVTAGWASGTYYVLACADGWSRISETDESNNCVASATTVTVTGPDLVETAVGAPSGATVGVPFDVTDAAANLGDGAAATSTTAFYLSLDATKSAGDVLLTGSRALVGLGAGEASGGSASVTVPSGTAGGDYYLLACADNSGKVAESNEANNCVASASTLHLNGADLIVSFASAPPAAAAAGASFAITDEVSNLGNVDAPSGSNTQYYLSTDAVKSSGDKLMGGKRVLPALPVGTANRGTSTGTIPAGTAPGFYYLIVCADDTRNVNETSDANNCSSSAAPFAVGLPDLVVDGLTASPAFPGDATSIADTLRNLGTGGAAASSTRYYFSTDATLGADDVVLGSRAAPALAAGGASAGTTAANVPASAAPGSYFVIACADADAAVLESDESNCVAAPLVVRDRCEGVVCAASDACHVAGVCNSATGLCSSPAAPDGTVCSDGSACSLVDTCQAGTCTPGAPLVCADGNSCTDDSCSPAVGCVFAPVANGTSCEDGSLCSVGDTCIAGACTAGAPLHCDDGNACTADACNPATGCTASAVTDGTGCSDGSACTTGDSCVAGVCTGGPPPACDDHNDCTADTCEAASGCVHVAVADGSACSDGSACTVGDTCQAGACSAGTPLACDDQNACTNDSCDASSGCVHVAASDGTSCSDGNVCNGAETCRAGTCSAGAPDNGGCDPVATCTPAGSGRTCACPVGTVDSHGDGTLCTPAVDCDTVDAVAAGAYHSCALLHDGTVRCWGYDSAGQLGDGTSGNFGRATPVTVLGLSGVVALTAAQFQTCALLADATVRCWGDNTYGQLGDGTTTNRATPVAVAGLTGVVSVAAGDNHVCAARTDGSVWCWGNNFNGQLGVFGGGFSIAPVQVTGLTGALQVAAGQYSSCAALADGTARCWGSNGFGQLGDGTEADSVVPVPPFALTGVVQVVAAASQACARLSDGGVRCWGHNIDGQLGDGTGTDRPAPVVTLVSNATWLAAGQHHTCAVIADGTMRCWGGDWEGQLGNNDLHTTATPQVVQGIGGATRAAAGWLHSCAIDDGRVRCWGYNRFGGLGDGGTDRSTVPEDPVAMTCQ